MMKIEMRKCLNKRTEKKGKESRKVVDNETILKNKNSENKIKNECFEIC